MFEMTSLFAGILSRSSSTVLNIGASMWVMDPAVQTVANSIPLPDSALDEVRSIPQVADGLRALDHDATALRAEDDAQRTAKDALHLIHINYEAGIATYLDVLSADSQYHQTMINDLQATQFGIRTRWHSMWRWAVAGGRRTQKGLRRVSRVYRHPSESGRIAIMPGVGEEGLR